MSGKFHPSGRDEGVWRRVPGHAPSQRRKLVSATHTQSSKGACKFRQVQAWDTDIEHEAVAVPSAQRTNGALFKACHSGCSGCPDPETMPCVLRLVHSDGGQHLPQLGHETNFQQERPLAS